MESSFLGEGAWCPLCGFAPPRKPLMERLTQDCTKGYTEMTKCTVRIIPVNPTSPCFTDPDKNYNPCALIWRTLLPVMHSFRHEVAYCKNPRFSNIDWKSHTSSLKSSSSATCNTKTKQCHSHHSTKHSESVVLYCTGSIQTKTSRRGYYSYHTTIFVPAAGP